MFVRLAPTLRSALAGHCQARRLPGARRVIDLLMRWQQRADERAALAALDSRLRMDVGLTAGQIRRELGKPFWRD